MPTGARSVDKKSHPSGVGKESCFWSRVKIRDLKMTVGNIATF